LKNKQDPLSLDAIIVTHNHTDHISDAHVMIEGMANYALKKRGILIGSKRTIDGGEGVYPGISVFHKSKVERAYAAEWNSRERFETERGTFELAAFPMKHD